MPGCPRDTGRSRGAVHKMEEAAAAEGEQEQEPTEQTPAESKGFLSEHSPCSKAVMEISELEFAPGFAAGTFRFRKVGNAYGKNLCGFSTCFQSTRSSSLLPGAKGWAQKEEWNHGICDAQIKCLSQSHIWELVLRF